MFLYLTEDICHRGDHQDGFGYPVLQQSSEQAFTYIHGQSASERIIKISLIDFLNFYYELSELEREVRQARLVLMPLLLAEEDRAEVIRRTKSQIAEAKAMFNLDPEFQSPIYKTNTAATRSVKPMLIS